eukprot:gene24041-biopygen20872
MLRIIFSISSRGWSPNPSEGCMVTLSRRLGGATIECTAHFRGASRTKDWRWAAGRTGAPQPPAVRCPVGQQPSREHQGPGSNPEGTIGDSKPAGGRQHSAEQGKASTLRAANAARCRFRPADPQALDDPPPNGRAAEHVSLGTRSRSIEFRGADWRHPSRPRRQFTARPPPAPSSPAPSPPRRWHRSRPRRRG